MTCALLWVKAQEELTDSLHFSGFLSYSPSFPRYGPTPHSSQIFLLLISAILLYQSQTLFPQPRTLLRQTECQAHSFTLLEILQKRVSSSMRSIMNSSIMNNSKLLPNPPIASIPEIPYLDMFCLRSYYLLAYHKIYMSVIFIANCIEYMLHEGRDFCLFFFTNFFFPWVSRIKTRPIAAQ